MIERLEAQLPAFDSRLPLLLAVLFGSYARGDYTVASDVDLLLVYRGERDERAFSLAKLTLDVLRLEPHVYAEAEYRELKPTLDRMTGEGIVLWSRI
ncbi:MAG: nucleotidyltransferase domain-containing protein [bacterium]|nr:nucleotidyltransferase domain-containing protein [bacterium]